MFFSVSRYLFPRFPDWHTCMWPHLSQSPFILNILFLPPYSSHSPWHSLSVHLLHSLFSCWRLHILACLFPRCTLLLSYLSHKINSLFSPTLSCLSACHIIMSCFRSNSSESLPLSSSCLPYLSYSFSPLSVQLLYLPSYLNFISPFLSNFLSLILVRLLCLPS